jgi:hypothetical protein
MISSASFSHGGTFLPVGFSADTHKGANSAATDGSMKPSVDGKTEADFLNAVNQQVTTVMRSGGTNAAFFAKQLNADPKQIPKTLRSTGSSVAGWTVGRPGTLSVTF